MKPAEYRFPLWINIPDAVYLFKQFTSNLDKPVHERVVKVYEDDNGHQRKTAYWGIFGGPDHYVPYLTKCATDDKGQLVSFDRFCDRWIELEDDRKRQHFIHPPSFQTNRGSGCSSDPYISDWDSICTNRTISCRTRHENRRWTS